MCFACMPLALVSVPAGSGVHTVALPFVVDPLALELIPVEVCTKTYGLTE
jgi:hypothetical protein